MPGWSLKNREVNITDSDRAAAGHHKQTDMVVVGNWRHTPPCHQSALVHFTHSVDLADSRVCRRTDTVVNSSLSQGRLPERRTRHIVSRSTHLKKPTRRLSTSLELITLSKIVCGTAVEWPHRYQTGISIRHHLTETAMLRFVSDALTTADGRHVTLYSLRTGTRTSVRTVCDLTAYRPL